MYCCWNLALVNIGNVFLQWFQLQLTHSLTLHVGHQILDFSRSFALENASENAETVAVWVFRSCYKVFVVRHVGRQKLKATAIAFATLCFCLGKFVFTLFLLLFCILVNSEHNILETYSYISGCNWHIYVGRQNLKNHFCVFLAILH